MIRDTETSFAGLILSTQAKLFSTTSQEEGRPMNCRPIMPEQGRQAEGISMHIHRGRLILLGIG